MLYHVHCFININVQHLRKVHLYDSLHYKTFLKKMPQNFNKILFETRNFNFLSEFYISLFPKAQPE